MALLMKRVIVLLLTSVLMLSSCATYRPLIDTKGVNMSRYERDLIECQTYAEQESPASQAAFGAVIGAAFGAILAAVAGSRYDVGASARVGAVSGGAAGAGHGAGTQMDTSEIV